MHSPILIKSSSLLISRLRLIKKLPGGCEPAPAMRYRVAVANFEFSSLLNIIAAVSRISCNLELQSGNLNCDFSRVDSINTRTCAGSTSKHFTGSKRVFVAPPTRSKLNSTAPLLHIECALLNLHDEAVPDVLALFRIYWACLQRHSHQAS